MTHLRRIYPYHKEPVSDHEMHVDLLYLSLGNTYDEEIAFCQAYPSSRYLDIPAYLQWSKRKLFQ